MHITIFNNRLPLGSDFLRTRPWCLELIEKLGCASNKRSSQQYQQPTRNVYTTFTQVYSGGGVADRTEHSFASPHHLETSLKNKILGLIAAQRTIRSLHLGTAGPSDDPISRRATNHFVHWVAFSFIAGKYLYLRLTSHVDQRLDQSDRSLRPFGRDCRHRANGDKK